MEKITTHSPLQLRSEGISKHERLLSLLTSESINQLSESLDGEKRIRLDVWNTFTKHGEENYSNSEERAPEITKLIDARYEILRDNYKLEVSDREVVRDDDEDYMSIVKETLADLITDKIISVRDADFHVCESCGYIIAPTEAAISICAECSHESLGVIRKSAMFLNYEPDLLKMFENKNFNVLSQEGQSRVRSSMINMPLSNQISKHRRFGIGLEEFGVSDDFVLDPKIGIALSGKVMRESGLGEITLSVQGIDSLKNNVPYTLLLDKESKTKFLNIGLVPTFSTPELERYGSLFYFPFLSLVAAGKNGRMGAGEIDQLYREFSKTQNKFESCVYALQDLSVSFAHTDELSLDLKISEFTQELSMMLEDSKLRDVVRAMRSFLYDWLSREYINECKDKGRKPDSSALSLIENVLGTVYKR